MYELTPELKKFDGLDIWNGLRNICDFLDELIKPVARKHGLTVTQLRLLCAVKRTAGVNIAAAANYAGIAAANASSMCKRLSELGFLRRHRSGSDDKVVRLELTDNGNVAAGEAGDGDGLGRQSVFAVKGGCTPLGRFHYAPSCRVSTEPKRVNCPCHFSGIVSVEPWRFFAMMSSALSFCADSLL